MYSILRNLPNQQLTGLISQFSRELHIQIGGLSRKHGIVYPFGVDKTWVTKVAFPTLNQDKEYTHLPLPYVKTGGRGPDGRIQLKAVGGGLRRPYFMVDRFRVHDKLPDRAYGLLELTKSQQKAAANIKQNRNENNNLSSSHPEIGDIIPQVNSKSNVENSKKLNVWKEKVLRVHDTWWRSEHIALVACGLHKRWLPATDGMKEGDIIESHCGKGPIIYRVRPGNSYSIGRLLPGTLISQLQPRPEDESQYLIKAGTRGVVISHDSKSGTTMVKLDSDHTVGTTGARKSGVKLKKARNPNVLIVSSNVMCVVGRMSNVEHNTRKFKNWGEKSWHGYRPRSGWYQKKWGRFGRRYLSREPRPGVLTHTKPLDAYGHIVDTTYGAQLLKPEQAPGYHVPRKHGVHVYKPPSGEKIPQFQYCTWSRVR